MDGVSTILFRKYKLSKFPSTFIHTALKNSIVLIVYLKKKLPLEKDAKLQILCKEIFLRGISTFNLLSKIIENKVKIPVRCDVGSTF